jgi:hypothetical protein
VRARAVFNIGIILKRWFLKIKSVLIKETDENESIPDFEDDLNRILDAYIEANEKYLQVASKFFSTSIEEDQNSLIKSAEDVIYHHAAAQLFTMVESVNIFKRAANKITTSSHAISDLIAWIESREKENSEMAEKLSNRKSNIGVYPIAKRMFVEQNFLRETKLYLLGIFRVLMAYFHYTFERSFNDLPMPTLLEKFQKQHKQSKYWLALPFVGLILNILGFIPLISVGTGIIGIVMFLIENYYLDGKELSNLKQMPSLAQQAQEQLETAKSNIDAVRNIRDFILDLDTFIPQETVEVINALKMGIDVDSETIETQRVALIQKITENQNRVWPGIGAVLKDNASSETIEDIKVNRKRRKSKHEK